MEQMGFPNIHKGLNTIAPNFWNDHIKFYELNTITYQNDLIFINIFNKFGKKNHVIEVLVP
jgi:hypothetical protein